MMAEKLSKAVLAQTWKVYNECGGNAAAAAAVLKIPPSTMRSRITMIKSGDLGVMQDKDSPPAHDDPDFLKAELKRYATLLKEAQAKGVEQEAIRRTIIGLKQDVESLRPPKWIITPGNKKVGHGVPTLFVSDLHWGEVVQPSQINYVNEYNLDIARARLRTMVERAIRLCSILDSKMSYPGIVVPLGGDMISGNIHDELSATNEINSMPAVLDLYSHLVAVINTLADTFGAVFLPCVTGNHGRDTTKIWGKDRHHTSFDWLLYCFLAKHFENDARVTFYIPDGSDAHYSIYNHKYLLTHGDQFRGGDGLIGCLGPILRGDHKKRSRNAQIDMEYHTMIMGHWHQYIHHSRVIVNSSLKGYDEYAFTNNFGFEEPQQALWLTHPEHGITYRMPVRVDSSKPASKQKVPWVSVPSRGKGSIK